jgi:hypothetical protein
MDAIETAEEYLFFGEDLGSVDIDRLSFQINSHFEYTEADYHDEIRFYHKLINCSLKEETLSVDKIRNYMAHIDEAELGLDELRERIARRESLALLLSAEARAKACGERPPEEVDDEFS